MYSPLIPLEDPVPSSSIKGAFVYPGCVLPSILTVALTVGKPDGRLITYGALPVVISKLMTFDTPALSDPVIAAASDPAPELLAFMTV